MKKRSLIICFSVIVLAMVYSSLVSAGTISGVIGGGRAGTTWDGWTQFQKDGRRHGEDWVNKKDKVNPGSGGQDFDAEYLYYKLVGNTLSIGLQTGFDIDDGHLFTDRNYYSGDIALSFDGTSNYTHAIDFGLYTEDYNGPDRVDAGSGTGIDTAGLYSVATDAGGTVTGWNNDILFPTSSPFAMDDGVLEEVLTSNISGSGFGDNYDANIHNVDDYKSYYRQVSFDITDFLNGGVLSVGAHWTMSCGNDKIKGSFQEPPSAVPEPGTIALLGIGLAGLAGVGARRRLKRKAVDKS